jgi:hypothetical protein
MPAPPVMAPAIRASFSLSLESKLDATARREAPTITAAVPRPIIWCEMRCMSRLPGSTCRSSGLAPGGKVNSLVPGIRLARATR